VSFLLSNKKLGWHQNKRISERTLNKTGVKVIMKYLPKIDFQYGERRLFLVCTLVGVLATAITITSFALYKRNAGSEAKDRMLSVSKGSWYSMTEKVTVEEAQRRASFPIKTPTHLPEGLALKDVVFQKDLGWVALLYSGNSATDTNDDGISLVITSNLWERKFGKPANGEQVNREYIDKLYSDMQTESRGLRKVNVRDSLGVGAEPGTHMLPNGEKTQHPGAISFTEDGIVYDLYGDALSLDELLKIANSMR
jgi:hypothetical protein